METIELQVDADVARTFQSAEPEQQEKVQVLMSQWLKRAMPITKLQATKNRSDIDVALMEMLADPDYHADVTQMEAEFAIS